MGDEGKLYVPPELVAIYREKVSYPIMGCCVCKLVLCSFTCKGDTNFELFHSSVFKFYYGSSLC